MVLEFLKELKDSFSESYKVYTEGSCFRLYLILKTIFPSANPYYSELEGHWITEIHGRFYDINGEIDKHYIEHKKYEHITNEVIIASAKIPRYKEQATSYYKYIKST